MTQLITIEELRAEVGLDNLVQIAGIGSHNSSEGRALDEAKINKAIDFASDLMAGYIARRYPEAQTEGADWAPKAVKGFVADVAYYRLRLESGDRNTVTEQVERRYKDALSCAKGVSRGQINIALEGGDNSNDAALTGSVRASIPPGRADAALDGYLS